MPQAVRRPLDSYLNSSNPGLRAQGQYLQSGQVPAGYEALDNNGVIRKPHGYGGFVNDHGWEMMAGLVGGGTLLGTALAPSVAASTASGALPSTSYAGYVPQVGSSAAASSGGIMGLSPGNWIDIAGLGSNFLGGLLSPKPQQRKSFDQYNDITNPHNALYAALNAIMRLGSGLDDQVKNGVHLRSNIPAPPKPVSIPGLPFQIGGGLATDPAIADPTLHDRPGIETFQPFNGYGQSLFSGNANSAKPKPPSGARRRTP